MPDHRRRTPPPLMHRVLPADFTPPAHPPSTRPDLKFNPPATPDWFPDFHPSASDLAGHRCGAHQMLILVAYDITDPKRLHRVAKVCEDWGMRVQYSLFECRLESDAFDRFWTELSEIINPKTDKLTAFKICTKCARQIHSHGVQEHYEKVVAYIV